MSTEDRPLAYAPPPAGIRRSVAGVSCGMTGEGHTRELIRADGHADLRRLVEQWRCACGRRQAGDWNR